MASYIYITGIGKIAKISDVTSIHNLKIGNIASSSSKPLQAVRRTYSDVMF